VGFFLSIKMVVFRIFAALVLLSLLSCCGKLNNEKIVSKQWKYGSGVHLGDVVQFSKNDIIGDVIYIKNVPKVQIIRDQNYYFWESKDLIIKEIATNKIGIYHEFGVAN